MLKVRIVAVTLLLLLSGCHKARKTGVCAAIVGANTVVVELPQDGSAGEQQRVISKLSQVQRLMDFANARRKVWQWKSGKTPSPDITAYFYRNGVYLGGIGSGKNFLYAIGPNWSGIRDAKKGEIEEFKGLIGVK